MEPLALFPPTLSRPEMIGLILHRVGDPQFPADLAELTLDLLLTRCLAAEDFFAALRDTQNLRLANHFAPPSEIRPGGYFWARIRRAVHGRMLVLVPTVGDVPLPVTLAQLQTVRPN